MGFVLFDEPLHSVVSEGLVYFVLAHELGGDLFADYELVHGGDLGEIGDLVFGGGWWGLFWEGVEVGGGVFV